VADPGPALDPGPVADAGPVILAAGSGTRPRPKLMILGACAVVLTLVLGVAWAFTGTTAASKTSGLLLFSEACTQPVSMGEHDSCVHEVQRLLARDGADIAVDSDFGPQTLRRVTAFQVLSGISPNGVVGDQTKKALYDPKVRMSTWLPGRVRKRVREVFSEEPDHAVAIADCQSFFDPFYVLPNTNGTRNWGVFQISDSTLRKLGGTPRKALEPEWNIEAAHRLWKQTKTFSAWPYCDRAYQSSPSASPSSASPSSAHPSASPSVSG
jgi:hypothetical protein